MVVATKYILSTPLSLKKGTWKNDGSKKEIHTKIVPREFVEERNSHNNNEVYVIDEDATKKMLAQREDNIKKNAENKKKESLTTADLIDAIVKPKKESKKKVEKVDSKFDSMDLDELKQYCQDNDIKYHHKAGKEKLIELIKK